MPLLLFPSATSQVTVVWKRVPPHFDGCEGLCHHLCMCFLIIPPCHGIPSCLGGSVAASGPHFVVMHCACSQFLWRGCLCDLFAPRLSYSFTREWRCKSHPRVLFSFSFSRLCPWSCHSFRVLASFLIVFFTSELKNSGGSHVVVSVVVVSSRSSSSSK